MFSAFEVAAARPRDVGTRWRCTICDHVSDPDGDRPPELCPVCGASLFEPAAVPADTASEAGSLPRSAGRARHADTASEVGRILILGAGVAGLTAAEQARQVAPDASITLLSKEPGPPYYRLNLTRFLAGEVEESKLALQPDAWFGEHRVELLEGEATYIHREDRRVELRDGRSLSYDSLVLSTGAHAFTPPIPGSTKRGVCPFRTLQDARDILRRGARPGARVVCLGGGLLGLEAAGALSRRGAQVTVLEGFEWLLPRQLAPAAGELLQAHLEAIGIEVRCGVKLEQILGDEDVAEVRLASGDELPADLVLLAVGVRPNSYLARLSGLEVDKGVVVDDRMQTSDPRIFAAGDVAQHRGVLYGLWPSSYAQGLIAGANAAGGELEFVGMPPSNRLKVLDVDLFSIGQFQPSDGSYQVLEEQREGVYYRLVCRDGRLVGANLYGETSLSGEVKTAVEEGTQIRELPQALLGRFPKLLECGGP